MYSKLFHIFCTFQKKKRLFTPKKQNKNIIKVPKGTKKKQKKHLNQKAKVMSLFYTLTGPTLLALLFSLRLIQLTDIFYSEL